MKHLKTKLMASAAMLLVATVMISSASFAWFTISTAPEVKGVNTKIASNGNLEIALADSDAGATIAYKIPAASTSSDTGKNTTWGNLVDISNYFTAVEPNSTLKPVSVSTTDKELQFPDFGTDGRVKQLTNLTPYAAKISASTPADTDTYKDGSIVVLKNTRTDGSNNKVEGSNWAYRIDYFMRTNEAGDISLTTTGVDRGNGETGTGCSISAPEGTTDTSYLKNIRVAFKVYDLGTAAAGAAVSLSSTNCKEGWLVANPLNTDGTAAVWTTDKIFTAEANKVYLIETYVYWDGASLSNADMTLDSGVNVNVQFKHSAVSTTSGTGITTPIALGTGSSSSTENDG